MTLSSPADIPHVLKALNPANAEASALDILTAYDASWGETKAHVKFTRFSEGWTNTLLKAGRDMPGKSKAEIDADAILVRGYGVGTEAFIDREKEVRAHYQLWEFGMYHLSSSERFRLSCGLPGLYLGLAPRLLARFENGLLYRFVPGTMCKAEDLRKPNVSRAIAIELGQWHSRLPLSALLSKPDEADTKLHIREPKRSHPRPYPNVWTLMQRWLDDLPATSKKEEERNRVLQRELTALCEAFVDVPGLCGRDYVFIHGDLHGANVIIREPALRPKHEKLAPRKGGYTPTDQEPLSTGTESATSDGSNTLEEQELEVDFIDYEYCLPAPPAFELAYHFSEWAGFECEYQFIPTKSERRRFIRTYVRSFREHAPIDIKCEESAGLNRKETYIDRDDRDFEKDVRYLEQQVDTFRGLPGMYWALWALIQAHQTGEDYRGLCETKIKEYWDWKGESDGSRKEGGRERSLRERRWGEE